MSIDWMVYYWLVRNIYDNKEASKKRWLQIIAMIQCKW